MARKYGPTESNRLEEARRALRVAIIVHDSGDSPEPHLATAIRLLRQETCARTVAPDEILALLRRAWADGDGGPDLSDPRLQSRTAEIVRLLLGEYHKQARED